MVPLPRSRESLASPEISSFAELLRGRRIRARLSQESLAERAAISVQAVSALERGARSRPYKDTVSRLAQALGISGDELSEFENAAQGKPRVRGLESRRASRNEELLPAVGRILLAAAQACIAGSHQLDGSPIGAVSMDDAFRIAHCALEQVIAR